MERTFITDKFEELTKGPVDTSIYHDESFFEKEREAIFRRSWMMSGRVEQIPNVGDFFTRSVPTFNMSLIVIKGKDEKIRTFQNACRHRGNQICLEKAGNTRSLMCRFHNWNYDLQGNLIGIPDGGGMFDLHKDDNGLIEVQTEIWNGFIFFNLDDGNKISLEEHLGGIGPALTGYPFNECTSRFQVACTLNANWKSVIDSFAETYHVPALHRHSIADTLAGGENKFGHLVDAVTYGNHRTSSVFGNKAYQPKPFQQIAYEFAGEAGAAILSGQGDGSASEMPSGVNPSRSPNWGVDVNVIFPNLVIVIGPGSYFCHQMWPTKAGTTEWEMTGFWRPAATAAQRVVQEYFMVELRDTVMEDLNTLERIQSNIDNGVIKQIHYHDHEVALRYQHHVVRSAVESFFGQRAAAEAPL
jgi:glycine betaine catabolism A